MSANDRAVEDLPLTLFCLPVYMRTSLGVLAHINSRQRQVGQTVVSQGLGDMSSIQPAPEMQELDSPAPAHLRARPRCLA